MRLTQDYVHKDFQPLSISASVKVLSAGSSPLIQTFNAVTGEYEPSRTVAPLCLLPLLELKASDGSMDDSNGHTVPYTNADLVKGVSAYPMMWYVNGKPISEYCTSSEYSIDTTGGYDSELGEDTLGQLTFMKDLTQNERLYVHFEGYVADKRTGQYIHIVTKPVPVGCIESAMDQYTLVMQDAAHFIYNPVDDGIMENEYYTANGISSSAAAADTDKNYRHTWNFRLQQGDKTVGSGSYSVKATDKETDEELSVDTSDGVLELSTTALTIDTRLRLSRQIDITVTVHRSSDNTDVEVASGTLSYETRYPDISAKNTNQNGYLPTDTVRSNSLMVYTSVRSTGTSSPQALRIFYPDRLLDFYWYTKTSNGEKKLIGEGSKVVYNISDVGAGDRENEYPDPDDASKTIPSCDYSEFSEAEWKAPLSVAVDDAGTVYTDADGNAFAFNS